ncbi:Tail-anchored protein insertion receptor WRB [Holothuria leucospilota]|uniref:Guided entry of tail-anchored proteins factor 1 n=1 Tax=Holothuria leucospilota TaxID=206669 RepID=A0A9Q1BI30_HOLLE|nr:Tail-anchored protein insertion receptor WRB [Holothuria leucospilota]
MAASMALAVFAILVPLFALKLSIPSITKTVLSLLHKQGEQELHLQAELRKLKEEQDRIDIKDEFAKHAKLQRKMNKVTDELKSIRNSKFKRHLIIQWGVTIFLHFVHKLCYLMVIWSLREKPVIQMKYEWTWPIGSILAFPCGQPGAIGITWWVVASSLVIRESHRLLSAFRSNSSKKEI